MKTPRLNEVHNTGAVLTGRSHAKPRAMQPANNFDAVPTGHGLRVAGLVRAATLAGPTATP